MKNLIQYIKESISEEFINQIISIFIAIGYVSADSKESINKDLEFLTYYIQQDKEKTSIYFSIADKYIYGILRFNNMFSSLSFRSIDNEFHETPCEKMSFDDMYVLLSSGTLRDLINAENKEGFIKHISVYKPEEAVSDNGWQMDFSKNTEI